MNSNLKSNPILNFRNINQFKSPSLIGQFDIIKGGHLNGANRFILQTELLVSATLITESREAVDSSEHSD